ncbi:MULTISPECIES: hypothetical protein [unclassified Xanthomonas]|uniref:hypothetical protein n=1 Tax=unclassified Xanthomonas TaxID=2643310 RepID=UPI0028834C53|nr:MULTISPECIES: hypothetical protein [unclassified Xanthomonas]
MPNYRTLFQDRHNIEQQTLKNSELLAKLQETGRFDIHAPENRLFLPSAKFPLHARSARLPFSTAVWDMPALTCLPVVAIDSPTDS